MTQRDHSTPAEGEAPGEDQQFTADQCPAEDRQQDHRGGGATVITIAVRPPTGRRGL
jgi:hypothetical protein